MSSHSQILIRPPPSILSSGWPGFEPYSNSASSPQVPWLLQNGQRIAVVLAFLPGAYRRGFLPRGSIDARHDKTCLAHEYRHLAAMVDLVSNKGLQRRSRWYGSAKVRDEGRELLVPQPCRGLLTDGARCGLICIRDPRG